MKTASGIPVEPLYGPVDAGALDYARDLGRPGEPPFTRGAYATMYRGRSWTMRPLAGFGTPEDTNARLRYLLARGATGLNVTFDYPSLRGYDSDAPEARAEAGLGGVAIDCVEDMERLFAEIPVGELSVSLVICNPSMAVIGMAMYVAAARRRGIALERLAGTCQNDFLMECAVTTAPAPLPPRGAFRLSCDTIAWSIEHLPRWHPVSFVGYNLEEAGATAVQEDPRLLAISSLSGSHGTLVPELMRLLRERGAGHVRVVVGGAIPPADVPALRAAGVHDVFPPGRPLDDLLTLTRQLVDEERGAPAPVDPR